MVVHVLRIAVLVLAVACGGASQNKPKTIVSEASIEILDPVSFVGDAELAPASHKLLDAVAATLDGNPSLKLIEVEVHVADGDDATRQHRADQRAQVIIDYLIGKGVAAARLRAKGAAASPEDPKSSVNLVDIERS
jgi:outer membrane protein OmpA-like peptidoglycan-associated protein